MADSHCPVDWPRSLQAMKRPKTLEKKKKMDVVSQWQRMEEAEEEEGPSASYRKAA